MRLPTKIVRRLGRGTRGTRHVRLDAHADTAPITAARPTSQRRGPASTKRIGARSGSHGRNGTAHNHRIESGATIRARPALWAAAFGPAAMRTAAPATAAASAHHRLVCECYHA